MARPPFTAELFVESYLNGVRIDSFLEKHLRNYTPWRLQRMIRAGCVRVNDDVVGLACRVYRANRIRIRLAEPPDKLLLPWPFPLEILFEDPWIVVVNKPPGIVAHPCGDFQTGTLANIVQAHLDQSTAFPGLLRPGIVHRLDRLTSGAIVVPKEHLSHRQLSLQFQQERVSKTYIALVDGLVPNETGTIDYPIGKIPGGSSILVTCRGDAIDAQPSRTRYEVIQRFTNHTLVRAKPTTGRFHQIRVHFATLGYPVTADEWYEPFGTVRPPRPRPGLPSAAPEPALQNSESGDATENDPDVTPEAFAQAPEDRLLLRHALHAHQIQFTHPITQEWMRITAPLAIDMRLAIERLAREAGAGPVNLE